MPPQIGAFIAQTVYPGSAEDSEPLLNSSEHHPLAQEESLLCRFVNVPGEQVSHGTSLKVCTFTYDSVISGLIPDLECRGVQSYCPACLPFPRATKEVQDYHSL
jgi:hypothetical protein